MKQQDDATIEQNNSSHQSSELNGELREPILAGREISIELLEEKSAEQPSSQQPIQPKKEVRIHSFDDRQYGTQFTYESQPDEEQKYQARTGSASADGLSPVQQPREISNATAQHFHLRDPSMEGLLDNQVVTGEHNQTASRFMRNNNEIMMDELQQSENLLQEYIKNDAHLIQHIEQDQTVSYREPDMMNQTDALIAGGQPREDLLVPDGIELSSRSIRAQKKEWDQQSIKKSQMSHIFSNSREKSKERDSDQRGQQKSKTRQKLANKLSSIDKQIENLNMYDTGNPDSGRQKTLKTSSTQQKFTQDSNSQQNSSRKQNKFVKKKAARRTESQQPEQQLQTPASPSINVTPQRVIGELQVSNEEVQAPDSQRSASTAQEAEVQEQLVQEISNTLPPTEVVQVADRIEIYDKKVASPEVPPEKPSKPEGFVPVVTKSTFSKNHKNASINQSIDEQQSILETSPPQKDIYAEVVKVAEPRKNSKQPPVRSATQNNNTSQPTSANKLKQKNSSKKAHLKSQGSINSSSAAYKPITNSKTVKAPKPKTEPKSKEELQMNISILPRKTVDVSNLAATSQSPSSRSMQINKDFARNTANMATRSRIKSLSEKSVESDHNHSNLKLGNRQRSASLDGNNDETKVVEASYLDDSLVQLAEQSSKDKVEMLPAKLKQSEKTRRRTNIMPGQVPTIAAFNGSQTSFNPSHRNIRKSIIDSDDDSDESNSCSRQASSCYDFDSGKDVVESDVEQLQGKIRRQDQKKEPYKKYSASRIDKEFTQFTKQERATYMSKQVSELVQENQAYYRGRELCFENNTSYKQCINNPAEANAFISIQKVNQSRAKCTDLSIQAEVDDIQIFNATDADIVPYAVCGPKFSLNLTKDSPNDTYLISFWNKDQNGQFQCPRPLNEPHIICRSVNQEMNFEQAIFTGENGKIFFFQKQGKAIQISILSLDNKYCSAANTPLITPKSTETHNQDMIRYLVEKDSILEQQLKYQLLDHKNKPVAQLGLPEPRIVKLKHEEYLILTTLNENLQPSISFFRLQSESTLGLNFQEGAKQMSGQPAFQIDGAELYLGFDEATSSIYFLTNSLLNKNLNYQNTNDQKRVDYARLISPSFVKAATVQELKQLSSLSIKKRQHALISLPAWRLQTSISSMSFFRCLSHQYPYVSAVLPLNDGLKSLTLRFSGSEVLTSTAVSFRLTQEQGNNRADDIEEEKEENDSGQLKSTIMQGYFTNEDDEQINVELQIKGLDATQEELDPAQCYGKRLKNSGGQSLKVRQNIIRRDWVFLKWLSSKNSQQVSHFSISSIQFDAQSGKIVSGSGTIDGVAGQLSLEPVELSQEKRDFQGERCFKLSFKSQQQEPIDATITGSYRNEPFNTYLIGQFSYRHTSGKVTVSNFSIQRRSFGTITIEEQQSVEEFQVECSGGNVFDRADEISFASDQSSNSLIENVHKLLKTEQGVFIFHGSLHKLKMKTNWARKDQVESYIINVSQLQTVEQKGVVQDIEQKDFGLSIERGLKHIISKNTASKNEDGVIQDFTVSQALDLTLSVLETKTTGKNTVKFIQDQLNQDTKQDDDNAESNQRKQAQGVTPQAWASDYPLIAYNSFLPNDSELILANLALKQSHPQKLDLGSWQFISFVNTICLTSYLKLSQLNCQIVFLARHRKFQRLRLLMIEQNPWARSSSHKGPSNSSDLKLYAFATGEIKLPPKPLDQLRSVHLIARPKVSEQMLDTMLLFQYSDGDMWSASMRQPDRIGKVFESRQVEPRHAVRRINDLSHVYCITESQAKMEVVKIELATEEVQMEKSLEITDIFESHSSKIVLVEADPDNCECLFVLDEEMKLFKILDNGEGKGVVMATIDISHHELEDEIEVLLQNPWTSIMICDRMISFGSYSFSLQTKFFWKMEADSQEDQLVHERNMPGTLQSIQLWNLQNGSSVIRIKPMAGCNLLDLIGQSRATEKTMMYFATDRKIIVNSEDNRFLLFDDEGCFLKECPPCLRQPGFVVQESLQSHEFGKFFLLKNLKDQLTILQSDQKGFVDTMSNFTYDMIKSKITDFAVQELVEKMVRTQSQKSAQLKDIYDSVESGFESALVIHQDRSMLSKSGELIMIATVVTDSVPARMTVFEEDEDNQKDSEKLLDSHQSGYLPGQKMIGIFQHKQVKLVLLLCQTAQQQFSLQSTNLNTRKSVRLKTLQLGEQQSSGAQQTRAEKRSNQAFTQNLTFSMVEDKLVWLDFERKLVQHIDLGALQAGNNHPVAKEDGKVTWHLVSSPGFTVREIFSSFSQEDYRIQGVQINEIKDTSVLRTKKIEEVYDRDLCLMQISAGRNVTVFNLQKENRYEVSTLTDETYFSNPIVFENTGFTQNTSERTIQTTLNHQMGIDLPFPQNRSRGVFKQFSEMDLQQVQFIKNMVLHKPLYTKAQLGEIETETMVSMFGKETFFTLFSEQGQIFEQVYDQFKAMKTSQRQNQLEEDQQGKKDDYFAIMNYIMDRPTPIRVKESENLTDLSILKHCLLYSDRKAMLGVYKIGEFLPRNLSDYITCIQDLQLIVERLPAQQYITVLNSVSENVHTIRMTEAIMARHGRGSELMTFIQNSAAVCENTPDLGLLREQNDDEIKRTVQVSIIPLQWIQAEKGTQAELFRFFRTNLEKIQSSLLLDAIFNEFWGHQQKLILKYAFTPYLTYFIVVNFYYFECMLMESGRPSVSILQELCEEEGCDTGAAMEPYVKVIFLILFAHQVFIELFQIRQDGFKLYISQRSNKLDILALSSNLFVHVLYMSGVDLFIVRIFASIAVVCLWSQMFLWFRLFDSLAQYVDLIFSTVNDITNFMYVLLAIMFMFSSGMHLLQINRITYPMYDKEPVFQYDDDQGTLFAEGLFNQYRIMLGDFGLMTFNRKTEGHDENEGWITLENWLVLLYFIGATFLTQITILNMLIAIMGSTFDRHNEDLHANSTRQKLVLQAEFVMLVGMYQKFCCCSKKRSKKNAFEVEKGTTGYLFLIQPNQNSDSIESSGDGKGSDQGSSQLAQVIQEKFHDLDNFLNKKLLKSQQEQAMETRQRLDGIERQNQERMETLKKDIMGRFSKLKDEMKDNISQMRTEMNSNHSQTQLNLESHLDNVNKAIPKAVNSAVNTDRENRKKAALQGRLF